MPPLQVIARIMRVSSKSTDRQAVMSSLDCLKDIFTSHFNGNLIDSFESCLDFASAGILDMLSNKDEEVVLTAGESLAVMCKCSKTNSNGPYVLELLEKLIPSSLSSSSKLNRRNISLYLLAIIAQAGELLEQIYPLEKIQEVLCSLLADGKSLTQESASKALLFLYNSASYDHKLLLAKRFVLLPSKFSTNSKSNVPESNSGAQADNQNKFEIFSELFAVCQDLNHPGMVYYMLDLACSDSVWLSDRGMKYSGNSIEHISELLGSRLLRIFPKLYRNLFHSIPFVKVSL
jgi:hypothetical protein